LLARGYFMMSAYLITVILARELGPADYGVYGFIMSVLVWIEIVTGAGVPGAIARLIPQYEDQASALELLGLGFLFVVSLIGFGLFWLCAPTLAHFFRIPMGTTLFRLAIVDLLFNGLYVAYQGLLSGHRRFGTLSAGFIVYSTVKLGSVMVLWLFLGLSIPGVLVCNALATLGALVYFVCTDPPRFSRPDYELLRPILRIAIPIGAMLIIWLVLLNLDLWALKSLWAGSGDVIGIYIASLNIPRMLLVIPNVLGDVLFVSLAWALARQDEGLAQRYIQAATRFTFVVLVPCCVLLAQHAEAVMTLVYSNVYAVGRTYLCLQLIAVVFLAFLNLCMNALAAGAKYTQTIVILSSLIPFALLLNLILIPRFGATGAALSLGLMGGLGAGMTAVLVYRRFGVLLRLSTVVRVMVATALMTLISTQLPMAGAGLLLKFVFLLGSYAFLLSFLKEIKWEDLQAFTLWQRDQHGSEIERVEPR
jgi:O-antigen/teichoic acid export membrane protein